MRFIIESNFIYKYRKTKKTTHTAFHPKALSGREGLPYLTKPWGNLMLLELSSWFSGIGKNLRKNLLQELKNCGVSQQRNGGQYLRDR